MTATTARRRGRRTTSLSEAAESGLAVQLRTELRQHQDTVHLLSERLAEASSTRLSEAGVADLERQIVNDPGWRAFTVLARQEFTATGMVQLRAVCRLMSIANPLMKHGLTLRSVYTWGQGYEVIARATGKDPDREGEQDVQAVVDAFLRDDRNAAAVFGPQACDEMERALGTDGEIYISLATRPQTGWVQARTIVADEITDIISDPDDAATPWFYLREWDTETYGKDGIKTTEKTKRLYPDVDYRPAPRPARFAGIDVAWDTPVVHVAVNRPKGWKRGIPDAYSVVNWARAYKEFLEQWAVLMRSLSKFAWKLTAEGRNRAQARAAIAAAGTSRGPTGEPQDIGGTAITPMGASLEAIPKSGATIDAESGRPIATMVAAGLDLPVTILLADPGQTGARATAETLDKPTELTFGLRRKIWTGAFLRILRYVVCEAVRAAQGPLKGKIVRDKVTDRETVKLRGDTDDTVEVVFPPISEQDPKTVIDAAVSAFGTGTLKPDLLLRLVLQALGVRDVEQIVDSMIDDQGKFLWPETPANGAGGPGQQAADLARTGGDPAQAGPGQMGPDGKPLPDPGDPAAAAAAMLPTTEQGVSPEALERQADAEFGLFGSEPPVPDDGQPDPAAPAAPGTPAAPGAPSAAPDGAALEDGTPPPDSAPPGSTAPAANRGYDPALFKI
ncbi:hypothetical protein [Actinoplanes sp. NBRC 101535]|uniref:hypothetical protein n=1 Tax=Actinoplanes sp. NBRC 101535 TaxID=3032196 RepID=UPI0024A17B06|nr:hypothetical protein [Actinoplanes sp. NBRC 101535]GLY08244.1 hypothetical protein Acsp01_86230 [Actinoplanes sp. NBRC 101535]